MIGSRGPAVVGAITTGVCAISCNPPPPHRLDLSILAGRFAVCRLDAGSAFPAWADAGEFSSVTRTPDEVSVICPEEAVPESVRAESGWRVLRVMGTQDFAVVGILASLVGPLAAAGISVFALATFDTDYLLIQAAHLDRAVAALEVAGHAVASPSPG